MGHRDLEDIRADRSSELNCPSLLGKNDQNSEERGIYPNPLLADVAQVLPSKHYDPSSSITGCEYACSVFPCAFAFKDSKTQFLVPFSLARWTSVFTGAHSPCSPSLSLLWSCIIVSPHGCLPCLLLSWFLLAAFEVQTCICNHVCGLAPWRYFSKTRHPLQDTDIFSLYRANGRREFGSQTAADPLETSENPSKSQRSSPLSSGDADRLVRLKTGFRVTFSSLSFKLTKRPCPFANLDFHPSGHSIGVYVCV